MKVGRERTSNVETGYVLSDAINYEVQDDEIINKLIGSPNSHGYCVNRSQSGHSHHIRPPGVMN